LNSQFKPSVSQFKFNAHRKTKMVRMPTNKEKEIVIVSAETGEVNKVICPEKEGFHTAHAFLAFPRNQIEVYLWGDRRERYTFDNCDVLLRVGRTGNGVQQDGISYWKDDQDQNRWACTQGIRVTEQCELVLVDIQTGNEDVISFVGVSAIRCLNDTNGVEILTRFIGALNEDDVHEDIRHDKRVYIRRQVGAILEVCESCHYFR
jgi:hypothetical protein